MTSIPPEMAIVNAIGPIRQVVRREDELQRRYLVIASGAAARLTPVATPGLAAHTQPD